MKTIEALKILKNNRTNVGLWSPACVQHGFTDEPSFTKDIYHIPSPQGIMVY
jgi:hypothetical protein